METLEGIKAQVQVYVLAVIPIPNNFLTPYLYAALQSACEGLCYELFAPCASTFLLHSFTHGVCHLQDMVHLAVQEFRRYAALDCLQMVLHFVKTNSQLKVYYFHFLSLIQRAFLLDCLTHIAFSIVLRINERLHNISLEWTVRI